MHQPRPIRLRANFGNVVVSGAVYDEKLAFLLRVTEDAAAHPIGNNEVAISMDHGDRNRQRSDPRDGIEMNAGDDSPQGVEAGNEHPPSHVLRGGERRLKDERAGPSRHRELSRDRAAEGMAEEN